MVQKVIVNTWVRRIQSVNYSLFGKNTEFFEDNKLLINLEPDNKVYLDLRAIEKAKHAYGECLVVIDWWGDTNIPIIRNITSFKKVIIDERLVYVEYTFQHKEVSLDGSVTTTPKRTRFCFQDNKPVVFIDADNNVKDATPVWTGEQGSELPCFIYQGLDVDGAGYGLPIYADALPNIDELDNTYIGMNTDRDLSRKLVLMPKQMSDDIRQQLKENQSKGEGSGTPYIYKEDRLFIAYPVNDETTDRPQYFDGEHDPAGFEKGMNVHLRLASMNSGLGNNYMSFDAKGGIKTATEVKFNDFESTVTEDNLRDSYGTLVKNIITRVYDISFDELDFTWVHDTLEDEAKRDTRLMQEYMAGLITIEAYHKERGLSDDAIKDLIPEEVPEDSDYMSAEDEDEEEDTAEDTKRVSEDGADNNDSDKKGSTKQSRGTPNLYGSFNTR